jgi:hypothetical protein
MGEAGEALARPSFWFVYMEHHETGIKKPWISQQRVIRQMLGCGAVFGIATVGSFHYVMP